MVIGNPPVTIGATQLAVIDPLPAAVVTEVDAPGTVTGVRVALAADGVLVPIALVAVTVIVYPVPLVSPVIVQVVLGKVAPQVAKPGLAVAVYDKIADPPSDGGAFQEAAIWELPGAPTAAVGGLGAVGTEIGVATTEPDGGLVPPLLVAVTSMV